MMNKFVKIAQKTLIGNRKKGYTLPTNNKLYPAQWNWDSAFIALGYSYFNLNFALKEYHQKYIESAPPKMATYDKDRYFKLQKYFPSDGYFVYHCESCNSDTSDRVLAWMIYLNDVTDDGYTEFPNQKKKYKPRTGDMLVWPAYFTHTHRGVTSKSQTKYIATGWFNFL